MSKVKIFVDNKQIAETELSETPLQLACDNQSEEWKKIVGEPQTFTIDFKKKVPMKIDINVDLQDFEFVDHFLKNIIIEEVEKMSKLLDERLEKFWNEHRPS
jgi:hypothetical protein